MIRESPLKNITVISSFQLETIRKKFQISDSSDFSPLGEKNGKDIPWSRVSTAVLFRDGYRCRVCGNSSLGRIEDSNPENRIHIDVQVHHIVPRKDGGSDSMRNLITLCSSCHHRTFSSDYSGIPLSSQRTLLEAASRVNLVLPGEVFRMLGKAYRYGTLYDVSRTEPFRMSHSGAVQAPGQKVEVAVSTLGRGDYSSILGEIEEECRLTDYYTASVRCGSAILPSRVLLQDSGRPFV